VTVELAAIWHWLVAAAGLAVALTTLISRRDSGRDGMREQLGKAQTKEGCEGCRKECRKELLEKLEAFEDRLETRASKAEVIAHGTQLAEHATAVEVLRTELRSVRDTVGAMDKKLDRLLERE
jgi:hypothetical protein